MMPSGVPPRLLRAFLATGPALLAGFFAFALWVMWEARQEAWNKAALAAANLTTVVERDLSRNIDGLDLSLQGAIKSLSLPGIGTAEPGLRQAALFDISTTAHDLGAVMVIDAAGDRIYESVSDMPRAGNVSGRDYFTVHRDRADAGLHISHPFRRMHGGDWAIALSRRLPSPDGAFVGIVAGTMRLASFSELVRGLDLGDRGTLTLLQTDGTIVARAPPKDESVIGKTFPHSVVLRHFADADSGTFEETSVVDGVRRLYAYRKVGDHPLIVVTATAMDTVYAEWRTKALQIALIVVALGGTGMMLVALLRREVRRRLEAERAARASEAQYRAVADYSSDAILRTGLDGVRRYLSPSTEHLVGYRPDELVGRRWTANVHPDDRPIVELVLARLRGGIPQVTATYRVLHKDGSVVWIESQSSLIRNRPGGEADEIVTIARDVTARKQAEDALAALTEELAQQATTDALTGLANRRQFDRLLEQEVRRMRREAQPLSLLLLDADCFKLYNDRYGHPMGDQVLRNIAEAIRSVIRRPGDVGVRHGGEEFAVILPNTPSEGAVRVAEAIRKAVAAWNMPHERAPAGIVTVSVGAVSVHPGPDTAVASLLADADRALYAAKAGGRNRTVHAAVGGGTEAVRC
ncbi:Diguanylate cyclase (plasmid) [Rhodovastum atsumiense]|uniref:diguanylate cyclase n=1 Tax=Rhodovastum atsumiense TaxID=504468 RepID=A0A5M6IKH1_9PROT|nr:diguanylate cyclase [Rhodovastum atsumiense]KAA5608682.1 diguanylate cyclase [Rhodovastum atsumiense]CAH2605911.1 Diguanylate cyclase [Rhodovastum atsumiense]